ncbi:hypothetical protein [Polymorphobacter fuscus]|uniref:Uncharacterized protein n=1 Tax=Sandarakinorhabdus fusca TaxID=1439888 RepID=A0A7C9GRB0_9SPHN|nr:hypothetical protein [Polymorphobacter fuscus]KAB7644410.1 hypothetical protein F9290_13825 [Polymorphobacter fuscus]MQT18330.1 hypothetical protein [Polymorphobacter fuscus]
MNQHPDHDPANDQQRVDASVNITVKEGVIDHRDEMMAGRPGDGLLDAGDNLGEHGGTTLTQPPSASGDAVIDDRDGIMAQSISGRLLKAGKASANDTAEGQKTIKRASNEGLENRANPYPPPGTISHAHAENVGNPFSQRSLPRPCHTTLLHNRGRRPPVSSENDCEKGRRDCLVTP